MNLDDALAWLASDPDAPLDPAEVALHLARDEYPDLDVEAYLGELAGMAHEARAYVRGTLEARVHGLCRYLFHDQGFRGNVRDYYDPRNSYFNQVLDRRTGLPITMSLVAMTVGSRAGLDVVGIALPGHFVAKAVDGPTELLFDPFHGGRPLTRTDCELLVEKATGQPYQANNEDLRATPLGSVVTRILTNLKGAYLRRGRFPKAARVIGRLRQLVPDDVMQRRDLGVVLVQAGQPGPAIDELEAYLAERPEASDANDITQLIEQARAEVARWN